jgi:hypothetical protein
MAARPPSRRLPPESRAEIDFFELSGAPPEVRFRRLLAWLGQDLGRLDEEKQMAVTAMLHGASTARGEYGPYGIVGWTTDAPWGPIRGEPMSETTLRRLHTTLRSGLMAIVRGKPWTLPAPERAELHRHPDGVFGLAWRLDQEGMILYGVAQLVRTHGTRVRSCKQCGALFLATKRQEYDRPACGQLYRDRAKTARAQGGR